MTEEKRQQCTWCHRVLPMSALKQWPGGIGCIDEDDCDAALRAGKGHHSMEKLMAMLRRLVN